MDFPIAAISLVVCFAEVGEMQTNAASPATTVAHIQDERRIDILLPENSGTQEGKAVLYLAGLLCLCSGFILTLQRWRICDAYHGCCRRDRYSVAQIAPEHSATVIGCRRVAARLGVLRRRPW